ncbi:hypothetical protein Desaci_3057 [Desulfosporosinus acidiphilus SJ4]|uniref:Lipoprotein n=1 Tax=Desulfosporosinus acidiphilus (strain DSM 22704 / JCM 16185 / SJ4) TaxID=646529 RepID=I4D840_DESAJ|nr:hypothetical protein [Desulfosporosinus acidiphilus]AFM41964.1 hypothetical protein Desaci_3057 [Desulfosporosinus acidiphilus SJ4]
MRRKRIIIWVALAMTMLLVLTGCSLNEQEIFNAALNMQNVHSGDVHTSMTLHLSGTGFAPDVQQQIDTTAALLNNASLDLDVKSTTNDQKTVSKSQVLMNVMTPGMKIDVPIWVDSDLSGDTPKINEVIKLPLIAKSSLPQQFASKDYLVMNPLDASDSKIDPSSFKQLLEFSKTLQEKEVSFLKSYSTRFNPNFDTASSSSLYMQTDDGFKMVRRYEIRLDDQQFKDFIRYAVTNFAQDKEAMNFVKDIVDSTLQVSQAPDKEKSIKAFDQAFDQFNASKENLLTTFNTAMDQLKNVTILGDKGLDLNYYLYNGYIIRETGTINVKVDLKQWNQFLKTLNEQQGSSDEPQGTLDMILKYDTTISGINTPQEIQTPEVNSTNSFTMKDLLDKTKEK